MDEEFTFGIGLRGPPGVPKRTRLLDVVFDLGEASAVRTLGACVEYLAGIAECPPRRFGRRAALGGRSGGVLGGDEVEHVQVAAGLGEEPREVTHPLEVSHSHRAPLEHHRPVVPLATEAEFRGRVLVRSVRSGDLRDPLEDSAGGLELQVCLVLAAAGP